MEICIDTYMQEFVLNFWCLEIFIYPNTLFIVKFSGFKHLL